jgi:hypothetical protein
MPMLLDKLLAEYAGRAFEAARLRRNSVHSTRHRVSVEMLAELESSGDAVRFLNAMGSIAWRATPKLRQYFKDMELDAEADLEDI